MSEAVRKPAPNAAARHGRKKMRVLAVLAAITLLTWSRNLFGGEDDSKTTEGGKTATVAKEKGGSSAAKGPKLAKSILTFDQAMERMKQWPEALSRRVIEGPIEEPAPTNWALDPAPRHLDVEDVPEPIAEPVVEDSEAALAKAEALSRDHADGSSLGITLRSTVIFGSKRYAVLNGVRYAEGEMVVAGAGTNAGRYLLVSVRSREVILSSGEQTWTLVIRDQSTSANQPDQAE